MQLKPLRLGVIGMGRPWRRRYRPALQAMPERFVVTAVCDPVWDRTEAEARAMQADAVVGPAALLERQDLDALLFVSGSWQRLWPLELAARRGLPTLCRLRDRDVLTDTRAFEEARQSPTRFLLDLGPRYLPVTARLRELLADSLGRPRVLLCDILSTRPASAGVALGLIDWCCYLFGEPPERVVASPSSGADFSALVLRWADGRLAALRRMRTVRGTQGVSLQVIAERGNARVRLPRRLAWTEGRIKHAQRLPPGGCGSVLEAFYEVACTGKMVGPDLAGLGKLVATIRG